MIAPGLYLLIWLLILGAAIAYAADDFVEVKVCSREGAHPLEGARLYIRKESIVAFHDDHGKVKPNVCTTIMMSNGRKMFVDGSVEQIKEALGEK